MIKPVNENSFLIILSDKIDLSLTAKIANIVKQIEFKLAKALIDITPSYTTILVQIDLLKISPLVAEQLLVEIFHSTYQTQNISSKLIELPVYYDVSVGWDLKKVASEKRLSIDDVITLHCEKIYQVCAVGFTPGFAFLAELDDKIKTARHDSPRAFVPAGSVAIADSQTAVYPSDSPGGWHIIGNCPIPLFDLKNNPISPFKIGDQVTFSAINYLQFIELGGKIIDEH
ncbi:5-oxoprolinase subunit B family protein [Psychromonas hadalis]|uniref:5-oxoprolinase subunit B family protein n=1 Tax=Psychromonas hadalis TaxID=211669 RepID=UPI0003B3D57D|nr:allophanate hydrolase subunit 1 [Psychromonas hadalis]